METEPRIGPPRCYRCGGLIPDGPTCATCGPGIAYRDDSGAAGVVTKRIDRGDGASEVSFYAISPKRSTYAEALADLRRFDAEPLRKLIVWMAERERQAADEASAQDHDPAGSAERQAICDREARSFREVIDRLLAVYPDLEPNRPEVPRGE